MKKKRNADVKFSFALDTKLGHSGSHGVMGTETIINSRSVTVDTCGAP